MYFIHKKSTTYTIDLKQPLPIITSMLKEFFWNRFIFNYDLINPCTLHYMHPSSTKSKKLQDDSETTTTTLPLATHFPDSPFTNVNATMRLTIITITVSASYINTKTEPIVELQVC